MAKTANRRDSHPTKMEKIKDRRGTWSRLRCADVDDWNMGFEGPGIWACAGRGGTREKFEARKKDMGDGDICHSYQSLQVLGSNEELISGQGMTPVSDWCVT